MDPRRRRLLSTVLVLLLGLFLAWAQSRGWLPGGGGEGGPETGGAARPSPAEERAPTGERAPAPRSTGPEAPRSGGYRPASAAPADAIPGGSLAAHEERGHTLARHVGRTLEQLRQRLRDEDKREVSTFPDLATADRAVAQTLFERQAEVRRWLEDGARGDQDVSARLAAPVGEVLFAGEARTKPGRTVKVVLFPSRQFAEGFGIRTAYVRP